MAVEPQIDEATRNFKVRTRLSNSDFKMRPGQFGKVRLTLPGERTLLVVPRTAISYNSYGTSVFVVQKMKTPPQQPEKPMPGMPPHTDIEVVQRFVKMGEAQGDYVAVVDGLKEGEQVATSGLLKLRNQQPVIINNAITPKTELNPTTPQN
jgi:membrane fusion protein (multidrug efflux system)